MTEPPERAEPAPPRVWHTPEALVGIGFARSRIVMMNEAHNGLERNIRTRLVGRLALAAAHEAGVRHLAMEALVPEFAEEANVMRAVPPAATGYLAQPEMRDLLSDALRRGWTLIAYEADFTTKPPEFAHLSREETNWRDDQQARNLLAVFEAMRDDQLLLVWCGNGHLTKRSINGWEPMAHRFRELAAVEPFSLDQTATVRFGEREPFAAQWVAAYADELACRGGTAGFLAEDAPDGWGDAGIADAFLLSLHNALD